LLGLCDDIKAAVAVLVDCPDAERPYRIAPDFLRLVGLVLLGFAWARAARLAEGQEGEFYRRKVETAQYYFNYVVVEADYRVAVIKGSGAGVPFIS